MTSRMPEGPDARFHDDLIGLDPDDPEARAFAEHLHRMERTGPRFTVEGALDGIAEFAESSNRVRGHYRAMAVLVVSLILLGVAVSVWDTISGFLGW
ncbi:hypothetical protein [Thermocrispum sp.]|uniref:Uncharacterized protein n=1 Tax=Thermocrispum agreste TaxID=37925 RepID=A0A2W4L4G6_9PSEU|nr:hypothetical protein [Thermocrispum sp.]PZM90516.1 MAG: hypothetical protein DIU77_17815 [Thermocrispum agreste]